MIPFLLGVICTLGLVGLGYMIYRSRSAQPVTRTVTVKAEPPLRRFVEPNGTAPQDLMNLESAVDLRKVMEGVAAIKRAEDARKRGA